MIIPFVQNAGLRYGELGGGKGKKNLDKKKRWLKWDVRFGIETYVWYNNKKNICSHFVVAGCTVTESGEPEQVKIRLVPQMRGDGNGANRRELAAFINEQVDVRASGVQSFPQAYRMYKPLRKVVSKAWTSLKRTYVALGLKYLQAYLNEYTGRRRLRLSGEEETMWQKLLYMGVAIPALPYRRLMAREPVQSLAAAFLITGLEREKAIMMGMA